MNLEKLINGICNAEYQYENHHGDIFTKKIGTGCDKKEALQRNAAITKAVCDWGSAQMSDIDKDKRLGELEAKVYTYEAIIANSNFAPMIERKEPESIKIPEIPEDNEATYFKGYEQGAVDFQRACEFLFAADVEKVFPESVCKDGGISMHEAIATLGLKEVIRRIDEYHSEGVKNESNN